MVAIFEQANSVAPAGRYSRGAERGVALDPPDAAAAVDGDPCRRDDLRLGRDPLENQPSNRAPEEVLPFETLSTARVDASATQRPTTEPIIAIRSPRPAQFREGVGISLAVPRAGCAIIRLDRRACPQYNRIATDGPRNHG